MPLQRIVASPTRVQERLRACLMHMTMLAEARGFFFQTLIFEKLGVSDSILARVLFDTVVILAVFIPAVMVFAMFAIWWERKVAGHMQSRLGPNRVGPIGILQSLADGIKLLTKEDLLPKDADSLLFRLAPYLAFAPAFAAFLALPFGPEMTFEPRLNVRSEERRVGKECRCRWSRDM